MSTRDTIEPVRVPASRAARSMYPHAERLLFTVVWLDDEGARIGFTPALALDLSDAIGWAAMQIRREKGAARAARGFYVRRG